MHPDETRLRSLVDALDLETKVQLLTGASTFTLYGCPEIGLAAMNRIDVHGGLPRPVWHHRHVGMPRGQRRIKLMLELLQDRGHVADGAVAQKRHRTVGDAAQGFDFRPPHPAMADADPVHIQGFGDDYMIDARF